MPHKHASFSPTDTTLAKRQFVSDVNWYIFLMTLAVLGFVTFQYVQDKASLGRLLFASAHPAITFLSYRLSLSNDPARSQFSHRIFCMYLVFSWNVTFIMNGGFSTPTSVWLILAPLFVVTVLGTKAAVYTVLASAVSMALVLVSQPLLGIDLTINDSINAFNLGLFHVPSALILAFFTMRRYSAANESALNAQQRLLDSQQNFLSNMSHELRTPINGIYGVLQILAKNNTDPQNKELIEVAEASTQSLTTIINDILHAHQIDEGILEIKEEWVDSQQMFANIRGLFVPSAQLKNILFSVRADDSVPPMLYCDALRLGQVINNITGNAIKFTQQGYVKVTASYEAGELTVRVSDTGVGMDQAALYKAFERFSQADNSPTRRFGGMGLGLSISHDLMLLMGGEIKAISSPNQGTTVTISVPLQGRGTTRDTTAKNKSIVRSMPSIDLAAMHVLIVEDNLTNQLAAQLLLEPYVKHVDIANHGAEALDMLNQNKYHVVLTDINMPTMDGLALLAALRAGANDIPVIAMTATADQASINEFEALGFSDIVIKPVEEAALLRAIIEAAA
jgi:signal transduction histidine kinase/CheY-like chemotaxis protein